MYLEIALLILVIILIVLVIFCIPVILQIWRISKDVSVTLQLLNQSFPLIMKNLEENYYKIVKQFHLCHK